MMEGAKKKTLKGRAPPAAAGSAARQESGAALADHAALSAAVDAFVSDNSSFESSYAIKEALDDANRCSDLQTLFAVPLRHKLFSLDGALRWALFLHAAPDRAVQEGDPPFSEGAAFSSEAALTLVTQIYDRGTQEAVWDHFEPDEEDEGDEGDDETGEGSASAG